MSSSSSSRRSLLWTNPLYHIERMELIDFVFFFFFFFSHPFSSLLLRLQWKISTLCFRFTHIGCSVAMQQTHRCSATLHISYIIKSFSLKVYKQFLPWLQNEHLHFIGNRPARWFLSTHEKKNRSFIIKNVLENWRHFKETGSDGKEKLPP